MSIRITPLDAQFFSMLLPENQRPIGETYETDSYTDALGWLWNLEFIPEGPVDWAATKAAVANNQVAKIQALLAFRAEEDDEWDDEQIDTLFNYKPATPRWFGREWTARTPLCIITDMYEVDPLPTGNVLYFDTTNDRRLIYQYAEAGIISVVDTDD